MAKHTSKPASTDAKAAKRAESNSNWHVVHLDGMTKAQRAEAIAAELEVKPAAKRKTTPKINKDAAKVTKSAGKRGSASTTVKSKAKTGPKAPTKATSNARTREDSTRTLMTDEVIDALLMAVSGGKSLVKACALPGMPNRTAFLNKVASDAALQARYAAAMAARADKYAEETIDIADDGANDTYVDEEGRTKVDVDVVARSKLRIAARQWYAAKIAPKKYGDKVDVNHGGQEGNPVEVRTKVVIVPPKQAAEVLTRMLAKAED